MRTNELILALKEEIHNRNYCLFSSFLIPKGRMSSLKLFIFILSISSFVPLALAQAPKAPQPAQKTTGPFKVALLPLTIHSSENLEYMREGTYAMFSSRVELEGRVTVMERAAVKKALSEVSGEIDSETAQKSARIWGLISSSSEV